MDSKSGKVDDRYSCCGNIYPSTNMTQDGDTWTCPNCKTKHIHECDEAIGCVWLKIKEKSDNHQIKAAFMEAQLDIATNALKAIQLLPTLTLYIGEEIINPEEIAKKALEQVEKWKIMSE